MILSFYLIHHSERVWDHYQLECFALGLNKMTILLLALSRSRMGEMGELRGKVLEEDLL